MAKNKTSKFGVADGLQYTETRAEQPQETPSQETAKINPEELAKLIEASKQILESVPAEIAEKMTKKQGRPPKDEAEKLRGYRYNLNLDKDLKEYLHEMAWKNRTSITQYINDLIRTDMENNAEWTEKKQ